MDAHGIVDACLAVAREKLGPLSVEFAFADGPSRVAPRARGRYSAGLITLFPRAFADPTALAFTVLHELAHAAGRDEVGADAFAASTLNFGELGCELR
jgi:hypothetical protein